MIGSASKLVWRSRGARQWIRESYGAVFSQSQSLVILARSRIDRAQKTHNNARFPPFHHHRPLQHLFIPMNEKLQLKKGYFYPANVMILSQQHRFCGFSLFLALLFCNRRDGEFCFLLSLLFVCFAFDCRA